MKRFRSLFVCASRPLLVTRRNSIFPQPVRFVAVAAASSSGPTGELSVCRSLLFVPGRRDLLEKAIAKQFGPDVLVPDMEDSVQPNEKVTARRAISELLPEISKKLPSVRLVPRVNALGTEWVEEDVAAVVGPHIYGISVGKVGSAKDVQQLDELLTQLETKKGKAFVGVTRVIPWLETANGLANAKEICLASPRLLGVAFGPDDFLTDMGINAASSEQASALLTHAKCVVAIAARSAGILALDGPYVNFKSPEGLKASSEMAKQLGYQGKFAIHPSQVDAINSCFSPSPEEVEYAMRVVGLYEQAEKEGKGTTSIDGKMIDAPVAKRAYALLKKARVA